MYTAVLTASLFFRIFLHKHFPELHSIFLFSSLFINYSDSNSVTQIWHYRQGVFSFCRTKNTHLSTMLPFTRGWSSHRPWTPMDAWSGYKFSPAKGSKVARNSYQHKSISAFCFVGWTKVTLLVLSKSDSSKHEITPSWLAQQWTQALLRASFRLPRFSTALTHS